MAHVLKARVAETSTSTGTGAFTLGGALVAHRTFSAVCTNGDTTEYAIIAVDGSGAPTGDWEVGLGTYSGNTLTRTTVVESSTGSAVDFAAGDKVVLMTPLSTRLAFVDPVITGTITEDVYTISDGTSVDIDPSNGSIQLWTLGANRTPTAANFKAGQSVTLMIADGTAYAVTWTTIGVVWVNGMAPTLPTSGYGVIVLWKVGSTVYGSGIGSVT